MMTDETMTLRELVDLSLELEEGESETDAARAALVSVLAVLRSGIQREIATNEGICASANKWVEQNGTPTIESVRAWVYALSCVDLQIPTKWVMEIMKADSEDDDEPGWDSAEASTPPFL